MPPPVQFIKTVTVTADTTLPIGTETTIATLPNISLPDPSMTVSLTGRCHVTTGAGATTVTLRVRRASLTGTLVGEADADTSPASTTDPFVISYDDQPGDVASLPYVLTATAAGVGGTALDAYLQAIIHTG